MPGNSIGQLFRLATFGESHGPAIGGVIDGCPAGLELDLAAVQHELDRRRPGSTPLGTARSEGDVVEFLSGMIATPGQARSDRQARSDKAITLGTPIGFIIRNKDQQSGDYDHLKGVYRPSHADRTWEQKYGLRDHRGGGRSSARETACRVVGGAVARQLLATAGVRVRAWVESVGPIAMERPYDGLDLDRVWDDPVRCPDPEASARMRELIERMRAEGDSVGGTIAMAASGVPPGLGEPVFGKLHADLGHAMLGINAVKAFEVGSGFSATALQGSEHNDAFVSTAGGVRTETNRSGGVQGGISNGEDITCRVAFKPPATIAKAQRTVDTTGREVVLEAKGRHDPCVVPRAVPIVEAMACLVLADHLLRQRGARV